MCRDMGAYVFLHPWKDGKHEFYANQLVKPMKISLWDTVYLLLTMNAKL